MRKIKLELVGAGTKLPVRADDGSAGFDCFLPENLHLKAGEAQLVPLGIKFDLTSYPKYFGNEYVLKLFIRSSVSRKGVILQNAVGIIDLSYPNEFGALLKNVGNKDVSFPAGVKLTQIILEPHCAEMLSLETLDATRDGGYGHTGE